MRALKRGLARINISLIKQRGHLFPWIPVFVAVGIGLYFLRASEPGWSVYAMYFGMAGFMVGVARRRGKRWRLLAWAAVLVATGFGIAGFRAHQIGAPVLGWRYYGPIEGRIVGLDRSASDAVRVTLDQVVLSRVGPDKRPDRVRISLHGGPVKLRPGQRIMTTGHLSPPQGPVEPGGFDFRRHAWFQGLGAVGYTRNPVLTVAPPRDGLAGLRVFALRLAVSRHIRSVLPGDVGGFAAAVTTGDRSGVSLSALEALRASNLAHLLAISGLHMGLLAGFVFSSLRLILCLYPPFALRVPVKKLAAIGAMFAGAVYLALSGGNVATERAFIMVAVMLCAVLVDRRALSLRAVAIAALIVLALRPEAMLGPGFQMSFAATTALVAFFGWMRDADLPHAPKWSKPVLGVLLSSAIAGLATAPIGAAHFNTLSHFGLLANLLSVPLMGVLVIPAAVLALCLAPFGLEMIGLVPMGWGLSWILSVGHTVSGWPGAQSHVPGPGTVVLPMLALGMLWLILWQGRMRAAGALPVVAGLLIWAQAERPAVLVADTGALVGVMTETGRALSKPRGGGFVARNWLENDGDRAEQPDAAARWPGEAGKLRVIMAGETEIIHVIGKTGAKLLNGCKAGQVLVASVPLELDGPCEVFDQKRLFRTGSLAISDKGIVTAQDVAGERLWNGAGRRD